MNANSKSHTPRAPAWLAVLTLAATAFATVCTAGTVQYTYDALGRLTQALYDSPPSAPGAPAFSGVTGTTATVTWAAATEKGATPSYQYQLYATNQGPSSWTSYGTATSINLTSLVGGVPYTFTLRACDALNVCSSQVSGTFTTANPITSAFTASTVTFQGVGGVWTVDAEFDLDSDGSINPICYQGCTVENNPTGNWFVPGTVPSNYQAVATNNSCSNAQGTFGTWQSLAGDIGWADYLNGTGGIVLDDSCTMTISIRAAINPSVILGSANVTFNVWTGD